MQFSALMSGAGRAAIVALGAMAILSAAPAHTGPLKDGVTAYEAQDYALAAELLSPLAEEGDPEAQYRLGVMHSEGQGVQRDYGQALVLYRRAAEQGHWEAQRAACREIVEFDFCEEALQAPAGQ